MTPARNSDIDRLESALRLALTTLVQLTDPDPQRGILTNLKLQGEQQGISLEATYNAVKDVAAVLRAELGEASREEVIDRVTAVSVGERYGGVVHAASRLLRDVDSSVATSDLPPTHTLKINAEELRAALEVASA